MKFRFRTPDGNSETLDDPAPVIARIKEGGSDFWNSGSGDAGIERGSENNPLMLELYFDGHGHFQLRYHKPDARSLIAQNPDDDGKGATIQVGGTPMQLAPGTLFGRAETAAIVLHFCETGKRHPDYAWK